MVYRRTSEISDLAEELGDELAETDIDLQELVQGEDVANAPVVKLLQSIFEDAIQIGASDIHIEPDESVLRIRTRVDGILQEQIMKEKRIASALVSRLKLMAGLNISERRIPQDGRFNIRVRDRSIELAQSTLDEILLKAYDEKTPTGGGCVTFAANTRCVAGNPTAQTEATGLGAEEGATSRAIFNDVDDYHNLSYCGTGGTADAVCSGACMNMVDESGNPINAEYSGYAICIRVSFAGGAGTEINNVVPGTGSNVLSNDAKRIDVIVTDPLNSKISLSAYRLNY